MKLRPRDRSTYMIAPCVALLWGLVGCDAGATPAFKVLTGSIAVYRTGASNPRQDASGAAFVRGAGGNIVLVDDGGDGMPPPVPLFRVDMMQNFRVLEVPGELGKQHGDLEGATTDGTWIYVTSSLVNDFDVIDMMPNPGRQRFHNLSRFKLSGGEVTDAETIAPEPAIVAALSALDGAWWNRVKGLPGRAGGLNVEALAATPSGDLLVGLRSPHFGPEFPGDVNPVTMMRDKTRTGDAVIVRLHPKTPGAFASDGFDAQAFAVPLDGLGFRSLEYSETAKGYFILAGIVEAGIGYGFYFWNGEMGTAPKKIDVAEFGKLCRPEAVTEIEQDGKRWLFVLSEESGELCAMVPYNYLLIELNAPFLARLK